MKLLTKRFIRAMLLPMILLFANERPAISQNLSKLTVSIHSANKTLSTVLDELENQTGYYFTFDSRLVDSKKKLAIDLDEISIQEAIDTLFQKANLTYKIINNNIVVFPIQQKLSGEIGESRPVKESWLEIHGVIKDLRSEKPLPYATIAVLDSYYGTISNEDGSFLLRIPDTLKQTILVASYIGYKNQYTPISLASEVPVQIRLNKTVISLQEVIIRYQDPVGILNESLRRIKSNYMNEPAGMQAYYREKVRKDDKCMIFSEAVVEIAKAAYTGGSMSAERARLLKGRKITNINEQDTIVLKLRSGLNSMLNLDIIKNQPDFLSPDFLLHYNLHFSNVVTFKDKLVYVISFEQKEIIQETLFRGDLYIDKESLAILAADFEYDPLRLKNEQDMFVAKKSKRIKVQPLSAQYHVEYSQTANYYHLSQVQGEINFKVRKRRQWIASRYVVNIEMAITNIDPGNPPNIKFNEQIKPSTILSDQTFQYDPDFWGEYNTIAPEVSLSEALNMIEKSMTEITTPSGDPK